MKLSTCRQPLPFRPIACLAVLAYAGNAPANTQYGTGVLASNTSGSGNSAFGEYALNKNTTGSGVSWRQRGVGEPKPVPASACQRTAGDHFVFFHIRGVHP